MAYLVKLIGLTMSTEFAAAGGGGDSRTKDLIATVSAIANSLMGEVAKVIIGKNENYDVSLFAFFQTEISY